MTDIRIRDLAAGALIAAVILRHRRQPKEAPPAAEDTTKDTKYDHPAITEGWQELGCDFVFACTTTEPVAGFFERLGFQRVPSEKIPDEKWRSYDPLRRPRVRCLVYDLLPGQGER